MTGAYKEADLLVARRIRDRIALHLTQGRGAEAARRATEATERASLLEARVRALTDELNARAGYRKTVGDSPSWRQALTLATQVASAQATVLLLGRSLGRPPGGISREAQQALIGYHWPGNVRELRNVLERAAILCDGGLIAAEHLALPALPSSAPYPAVGVATSAGTPRDLKAVERAMIVKALEQAQFNKSEKRLTCSTSGRSISAREPAQHRCLVQMQEPHFSRSPKPASVVLESRGPVRRMAPHGVAKLS